MNKRQYKKWWKYRSLESESIDITNFERCRDSILRRWIIVRYSPRTVRLFERSKRVWFGGKGRKGKYKYRPPKSQIFIDEFVFHREQTNEE